MGQKKLSEEFVSTHTTIYSCIGFGKTIYSSVGFAKQMCIVKNLKEHRYCICEDWT